MAPSQHPDHFSNVDIDPEAILAIHLHLRDGSSAPASQASAHHHHDAALALQKPSPRGQPDARPSQLTLDEVANMSMEELDRLQERVAQMETSNHGLLTRIYGPFTDGRQPFPIVVASRTSTVDFPTRGSLPHRQLLFSQYENMLAIAQNPTRCVEIVEPDTAQGAKALQDYQMQLMLLAKHKRGKKKRKQRTDDDSLPLRPAPQVERPSLKAMNQHCRVLDFDLDLRSSQRNNHHHESLSQNPALLDYQQQLMLLEEENQKRLAMEKERQERARTAEARVRDEVIEEDSMASTARPDESSLAIRQRHSRA
jgi:hypothetical protein